LGRTFGDVVFGELSEVEAKINADICEEFFQRFGLEP